MGGKLMGFMTVAFLLNDFSHTLEESPKTVAFMLANPPMYVDDPHRRAQMQAAHFAQQHGEVIPHSQALEVLPSFHADNRKFFMAGGNCISELPVVRVRKDRKTGRRVVVLDLPDYLQSK